MTNSQTSTRLQRHVTGAIKGREAALGVPDRHALKIARQALKYHCVGARVMGQSHREAATMIERLTGQIVGLDADCTC